MGLMDTVPTAGLAMTAAGKFGGSLLRGARTLSRGLGKGFRNVARMGVGGLGKGIKQLARGTANAAQGMMRRLLTSA